MPRFASHPDLLQLLRAALQPDPAARATAEQLLEMPFFADLRHAITAAAAQEGAGGSASTAAPAAPLLDSRASADGSCSSTAVHRPAVPLRSLSSGVQRRPHGSSSISGAPPPAPARVQPSRPPPINASALTANMKTGGGFAATSFVDLLPRVAELLQGWEPLGPIALAARQAATDHQHHQHQHMQLHGAAERTEAQTVTPPPSPFPAALSRPHSVPAAALEPAAAAALPEASPPASPPPSPSVVVPMASGPTSFLPLGCAPGQGMDGRMFMPIACAARAATPVRTSSPAAVPSGSGPMDMDMSPAPAKQAVPASSPPEGPAATPTSPAPCTTPAPRTCVSPAAAARPMCASASAGNLLHGPTAAGGSSGRAARHARRSARDLLQHAALPASCPSKPPGLGLMCSMPAAYGHTLDCLEEQTPLRPDAGRLGLGLGQSLRHRRQGSGGSSLGSARLGGRRSFSEGLLALAEEGGGPAEGGADGAAGKRRRGLPRGGLSRLAEDVWGEPQLPPPLLPVAGHAGGPSAAGLCGSPAHAGQGQQQHVRPASMPRPIKRGDPSRERGQRRPYVDFAALANTQPDTPALCCSMSSCDLNALPDAELLRQAVSCSASAASAAVAGLGNC